MMVAMIQDGQSGGLTKGGSRHGVAKGRLTGRVETTELGRLR